MANPSESQQVFRTSALREAGWSKHRISRAVRAGEFLRVRRGWLARPNADPELLFAVQHGVMLSCITAARRMGLWVGPSTEQHYAVPRPGAEYRPPGATLHYRKPVLPRKPFQLIDQLENTLDLVAHCLPHEEAVAVWDSALNQGMVDRRALERIRFRGRAKSVLEVASPFADSGLESYVRLRLRWLRIPVIAQAWLLGHRVDFLIGDCLVLQIDGGHHVGAQRKADNQHDAELRLRGYTVIRVGYDQVMCHWPEVQSLIMRAIAQGLHLR